MRKKKLKVLSKLLKLSNKVLVTLIAAAGFSPFVLNARRFDDPEPAMPAYGPVGDPIDYGPPEVEFNTFISVFGTVVDSTDGEPLQGVSVFLMQNGSPIASSTTSVYGAFSIDYRGPIEINAEYRVKVATYESPEGKQYFESDTLVKARGEAKNILMDSLVFKLILDNSNKLK